MSFDRQIDFVCPHEVVEETLFLNADRVTVRPLRPIAAINSLKVRLNGEVVVPSQGVQIPAETLAIRRGPYNIKSGVNDTLTLQANSGAVQTVQIDPGQGLQAKEVARRLNQSLTDAVFDVTPTGRLSLATRRLGKSATLTILPSTMAATLGLAVNRQWRGKVPYPGWSLIADRNTLIDRPTRLIVFDAPLQGFREFAELNYATIREECRRCGGLGVENDWRYGVHGEVFEVRDEALLLQEVQKAVYTLRGSNPFHRWYGTNVFNTIGKKLSAAGLVQSFILSDIREAFRRWQNIKKQQEEVLGQIVSDEEYPYRLISVVLSPSQEDPTIVFVNATIQNRSQRPIQLERGLRIPLPDDILGSTSQAGIIRQSLSNYTLAG